MSLERSATLRRALLCTSRRVATMPHFRGRDRMTTGLLRLGGTVEIQLADFKMALDPGDNVARHIALHSELPSEIPEVLRELAKPGMTVVDVGANIGYTTLTLAHAVGPEGYVYAFEPSSRAYRSLHRNLALNKYDWVQARRAACGDSAGEGQLHVARVSTEYSSLTPISMHTRVEPVPVVRLDDCVAQAELVKVDTEGAEWQVLRGATSLLQSRPVIVVETWAGNTRRFGYHPDQMLAWLSELGYEIEQRTGDAICR